MVTQLSGIYCIVINSNHTKIFIWYHAFILNEVLIELNWSNYQFWFFLFNGRRFQSYHTLKRSFAYSAQVQTLVVYKPSCIHCRVFIFRWWILRTFLPSFAIIQRTAITFFIIFVVIASSNFSELLTPSRYFIYIVIFMNQDSTSSLL